ncbi:hypothetical protein [Streptomyces sp. NPDC051546]|uniref:hypothetical protein n=1 Tax=Streptomyces sp. NPDC051546 TaxID=3365655 RepID=UPI0037A32C57
MTKTPRQLSARVDEPLAKDIETLAPTGLSQSEIVKRSVALFAEVYKVAVDNKVAAPSEIPVLIAYQFRLPPLPQPPRTGVIRLPDLSLAKEGQP